MSPQLHFRVVAGRKKTPGPRPEVAPKRIATEWLTGRLLRVPGERGGALVELVKLEAAGKRLLAVVVEEVIGVLVVEDGAGPGRRVRIVPHHRSAGEPLELRDRAEALLGVRLVPVVAVGQADRLADVGADVDLGLGGGAGAAACDDGGGQSADHHSGTPPAKHADEPDYGLGGVVNHGQLGSPC